MSGAYVESKSVDLNNWTPVFGIARGTHTNLPNGMHETTTVLCIEETPNHYYNQFIFTSHIYYREFNTLSIANPWIMVC